MPLNALPKDQVVIVKPDGSRLGPFPATVTPNVVVVNNASLDVTEGDHVVRKLPNGRDETYLITSANFYQRMGGLPDHYQLKVHKTTAMSETPVKVAPTINIHNSTGIQIGDHNTQHIQAALDDLVGQIDKSDATNEQKQEAKSRLAGFLSHPVTVAVLGAAATALATRYLSGAPN